MGMNYQWREVTRQEVENYLSGVPFEEIPVQRRVEMVVQTGGHEQGVPVVFAEGEIPTLSSGGEGYDAYFQVTQGFRIVGMSARSGFWEIERPLFFAIEGCTADSCQEAQMGLEYAAGRALSEETHPLLGPIGRFHDDGSYEYLYEELSRVVIGDFNQDGFNDVLAVVSSPDPFRPDPFRNGSGFLFLGGSALYPERPPLYFENFRGE